MTDLISETQSPEQCPGQSLPYKAQRTPCEHFQRWCFQCISTIVRSYSFIWRECLKTTCWISPGFFFFISKYGKLEMWEWWCRGMEEEFSSWRWGPLVKLLLQTEINWSNHLKWYFQSEKFFFNNLDKPVLGWTFSTEPQKCPLIKWNSRCTEHL